MPSHRGTPRSRQPLDDGRILGVLTTAPHRREGAVLLATLGVVYGDIGTSPLYALRECFYGSHSVPPTHDNVLGVLSLIIYSLVAVISIKYIGLVLNRKGFERARQITWDGVVEKLVRG